MLTKISVFYNDNMNTNEKKVSVFWNIIVLNWKTVDEVTAPHKICTFLLINVCHKMPVTYNTATRSYMQSFTCQVKL